ncbi:MAG: hypothetical protein GY730_11285 [bacterium]|nr:hypothetical protein [bacterium]
MLSNNTRNSLYRARKLNNRKNNNSKNNNSKNVNKNNKSDTCDETEVVNNTPEVEIIEYKNVNIGYSNENSQVSREDGRISKYLVEMEQSDELSFDELLESEKRKLVEELINIEKETENENSSIETQEENSNLENEKTKRNSLSSINSKVVRFLYTETASELEEALKFNAYSDYAEVLNNLKSEARLCLNAIKDMFIYVESYQSKFNNILQIDNSYDHGAKFRGKNLTLIQSVYNKTDAVFTGMLRNVKMNFDFTPVKVDNPVEVDFDQSYDPLRNTDKIESVLTLVNYNLEYLNNCYSLVREKNLKIDYLNKDIRKQLNDNLIKNLSQSVNNQETIKITIENIDSLKQIINKLKSRYENFFKILTQEIKKINRYSGYDKWFKTQDSLNDYYHTKNVLSTNIIPFNNSSKETKRRFHMGIHIKTPEKQQYSKFIENKETKETKDVPDKQFNIMKNQLKIDLRAEQIVTIGYVQYKKIMLINNKSVSESVSAAYNCCKIDLNESHSIIKAFTPVTANTPVYIYTPVSILESMAEFSLNGAITPAHSLTNSKSVPQNVPQLKSFYSNPISYNSNDTLDTCNNDDSITYLGDYSVDKKQAVPFYFKNNELFLLENVNQDVYNIDYFNNKNTPSFMFETISDLIFIKNTIDDKLKHVSSPLLAEYPKYRLMYLSVSSLFRDGMFCARKVYADLDNNNKTYFNKPSKSKSKSKDDVVKYLFDNELIPVRKLPEFFTKITELNNLLKELDIDNVQGKELKLLKSLKEILLVLIKVYEQMVLKIESHIEEGSALFNNESIQAGLSSKLLNSYIRCLKNNVPVECHELVHGGIDKINAMMKDYSKSCSVYADYMKEYKKNRKEINKINNDLINDMTKDMKLYNEQVKNIVKASVPEANKIIKDFIKEMEVHNKQVKYIVKDYVPEAVTMSQFEATFNATLEVFFDTINDYSSRSGFNNSGNNDTLFSNFDSKVKFFKNIVESLTSISKITLNE